MSQPPSAQSVAEIRTKRGSSAGINRRRPVGDSQDEAHAVLQAAAVLVMPPIGERREELVQQIPVRRVDLDHLEAGRQGPAGGGSQRLARFRRCPQCRADRAGDRPRRTGRRSARRPASPLQPASPAAPRLSRARRSSPCGRRGQAGCRPPPPGCGRRRAIRPSGSACASLHMPMSPGVMRPSLVTAVASTITRAAPPAARLPRWTRCQSFANPSFAQYWHMGEMTIRLRNVTPRIASGLSKSISGTLRS